MKDLHSHILYGIDDGCHNIDVSMEVLEDAYNNGITDIMLTPHYIENSKYNVNNKKKMTLLKTLQKELKQKNIDINLYLGNEIFINDNILELVKKKDIAPLNNSKYLLVELPMAKMYQNTKNTLFELIRNDYKVILAHPERYRYLQKDEKLVKEFLEMGILFQGNYRSLFGFYGSDAKKALKKFIKNGYITFLGSDIHKKDGFYMEKLEKKLLKLTKDENTVKKLLETNFDCVINNKDIEK